MNSCRARKFPNSAASLSSRAQHDPWSTYICGDQVIVVGRQKDKIVAHRPVRELEGAAEHFVGSQNHELKRIQNATGADSILS